MPSRAYHSPRRQEQAERTRSDVLAAARELFVDPGYGATRLVDVAARAGVSVQTVYGVFGSKRGLLSALVDVAIAGDDRPVALPDRPFVAEVRALTGLRAKLERFAVHLVATHRSQADVVLALAAAATADPDAAAVHAEQGRARLRGMTMFAADLRATGEVSAELSAEAVADVLWLATDVRMWEWLVRTRRWSEQRFRRWFVDSTHGALTGADDDRHRGDAQPGRQ